MGFRLLIVDDSSSMRAIVKRTIKMSGLDVEQCFEAGNGKEALDVLDSQWVDAILTDLNMPVMGGEEFLRALQANPLMASVPVVVITTEGRSERLESLDALGARAFVKKPFKPEEIRAVLMSALGADSGDAAVEDNGEDMDF